MNVKKEVQIEDLRRLGRLGGATALLLDGEEMILTEKYGLVRKEGVVFGKNMTVEVIEQYTKVYSKIRTIKWNNLLVARRVNKQGKSLLELTGIGYKRNN